MPHVVLEGPVTLEDIWLAYEHMNVTEGDLRFKIEGCYLSHDKAELLIRTLVVERGMTKKFFVVLHQRDGSLTIKLEPMTDPEKTDGVRRVIGVFAEHILRAEPETHIKNTNIREFIHI